MLSSFAFSFTALTVAAEGPVEDGALITAPLALDRSTRFYPFRLDLAKL
jgi:hypothetical protein